MSMCNLVSLAMACKDWWCRGSSTSVVEIEVTQGVGENSQMTMRGEGNQGFQRNHNGNLIIQFVEIERNITLLEMILTCICNVIFNFSRQLWAPQ